MSDAQKDAPEADTEAEETPKKGGKGLLFGLIGAVVLGGVTFFGVFSGMIPVPSAIAGMFGAAPEEGDEYAKDDKGDEGEKKDYSTAEIPTFIPVEPIIISLGPQSRSTHLKLRVDIEVDPAAKAQVESVTPRVTDVLNTYLRAVDERDFEQPRAMMRLRAQMLRRVQLVAPEGSVRDLLIQEFVLN